MRQLNKSTFGNWAISELGYIKLLANHLPPFWRCFFISPFWKGVAVEEFCLTTFAPEKNLHLFTATIFWLQLCNYISDGYLRALSCDTKGFKNIRRGASPTLSLLYYECFQRVLLQYPSDNEAFLVWRRVEINQLFLKNVAELLSA